MAHINEVARNAVKGTGQCGGIGLASIAIGATGAVSTVTGSIPVTAVRASAGTYTLGFPKAARGAVVASVKGADVNCTFSAIDVTAGTATMTTLATAGSAGDPASGSIITLLFVLEGR